MLQTRDTKESRSCTTQTIVRGPNRFPKPAGGSPRRWPAFLVRDGNADGGAGVDRDRQTEIEPSGWRLGKRDYPRTLGR